MKRLLFVILVLVLMTACVPTVTPIPSVTDTPTATVTPFISPIITNTPPPSPLEPLTKSSPTPVPTLQTNLDNGSFEPTPYPYRTWENAVNVAYGWLPWYVYPAPCEPGHTGCWIPCGGKDCIIPETGNCSNDAGCSWHKPEFAEVDIPNTLRIYSGFSSQKIFAYGGQWMGGLYRVVDVQPGREYLFTVHLQAWECRYFPGCDNGRVSDLKTTYHLRVGFDPTAGTVYSSTNIVWSPEDDAFDVYTPFSVRATATGTKASLWISAFADFRNADGTLAPKAINVDLYVDDANLIPISASTYLPEVHR